ncbi:N-acetyltransferase family protein [Colwelliaceae bacterium 6441]
MSISLNIRRVSEQDIASITELYNHYIANTVVTFEEALLVSNDIAARVKQIETDGLPWIIAEDKEGQLLGYAYASKWRERFAYRFSVEVTVYLQANLGAKGIGSQLYEQLFFQLKEKGVHSVIGGITLPNPASIALHEKFGMQKSAHFKEVGFKFNQWLDVGYWQGQL